jgi:glycosyltransferase involved in cell wall biosynthesis
MIWALDSLHMVMSNDTVKEFALSVVIPAYNEDERLPMTLERICDYLSKRSFSFEVIVVDDGSTDRRTIFSKAKGRHSA